MSRRETRYIKLAKTLLKVLGKCRIPKHFSKFSNKLYRSWQHSVLLVLRQHDSEENHKLRMEELKAKSIRPARNKELPVWRTKGKYRKQMKKGYSLKKYHQRSKIENPAGFSICKHSQCLRKRDSIRSNKRTIRRLPELPPGRNVKQRIHPQTNRLQHPPNSQSSYSTTKGFY